MSTAFELGVTHFDVARSYGFGEAESVLGSFACGRRSQITIATKFGVVPPQLTRMERAAMPGLRIARRLASAAAQRTAAKSHALLAGRRFDASYAQECLDVSLRELRTDYVDIYLLHEPPVEFLRHADDLFDWLDGCVTSGRMRTWGVAYRHPRDWVQAQADRAQVIQFEGNQSTLRDCLCVATDHRQRFVARPLGGGTPGAPPPEVVQFAADHRLSYLELAMSLAHTLAGPGDRSSVRCSRRSTFARMSRRWRELPRTQT